MNVTYEQIREDAQKACAELVEIAKLKQGDILVIGCSSSEVVGLRIGKGSDINAAGAVYEGVMQVLAPKGIYLAAQCCEHLNRAVIVEKAALLPGYGDRQCRTAAARRRLVCDDGLRACKMPGGGRRDQG